MRIFVPLMLTVVSVFLAGCGGQETPVEETEEAGGAEGTTAEETTSEKTNDRAKATTEETTTLAQATAEETTPTAAEAAVLEAPIESTPEPVSGVIGSQEEGEASASSEGVARDRAQTAGGIGVTQTATPDPATVGRPLTFTVVVTNDASPQHVGFKDFLPPGVTFVSATPDQGFCGPPHHGGNLFDCTLGTIPTGGSVAVEVVAIPTAPGTTTNLAQAGGGFAPVQSVPTTVTVNP